MKKGLLVLACVLGLATIGVASAQTVDLSYLSKLLNSLQQQANVLQANQLAQVSTFNRVAATGDNGTTDSILNGACAAGGSLPRGTFGQFMFCNGGNWVAGPISRLPSLAGSGGAYVCADAQGNLFRSSSGCATVPSVTNRAEISAMLGEGNGFRSIVYSAASESQSNITLGTFRLKAQNQDATINGLTFVISRNNNVSLNSLMQNIRLVTPDGVRSPSVVGVIDGRITFTNLNLRLPQGQWKEVVLKVDAVAGAHGGTFTKLLISSIAGVGADFAAINLASGMSDVVASQVTFAVMQTARAEISATLGYDSSFHSLVYTSPTEVTPNINLGAFRLMASNQDATINSLSFMTTRFNSVPLTALVSNLRLTDGVTTYGTATVSADGGVTFTNLNLHLTQNQGKDLALKADVPAGVNGQLFVKLLMSGIAGVGADSVTAGVIGADVSAPVVQLLLR